MGDRRAALGGAAAREVVEEGAPDAAQVDAVVLVEALVLDGDDRVLHRQRDVVGRDDDPALVGERREVLAADVDEDGVLRRLELGLVLELGQVAGDRHHHPEGRRDEREQRETEEDERQPQPLEPWPPERWLGKDRDVRTFVIAHANAGAAASCGDVPVWPQRRGRRRRPGRT